MSRETIIRQIVELDLADHSLIEDKVRESDGLLHTAALGEFGAWETALGYAGVNVREVGRCRDPTPERFSQRLRRLCTTGYDPGATAGQSRSRTLCDAVPQHFGSWRKALTASGIKLVNVSRRRLKHLDRDVLILCLQQRQAEGKSLKWTVVCLENRTTPWRSGGHSVVGEKPWMLRACQRQRKIQPALVCGEHVSLMVDFATSRERTFCGEGISRGGWTHRSRDELSWSLIQNIEAINYCRSPNLADFFNRQSLPNGF